ncbi:hypothetical protein GCM10020218_004880 [Dactylosporangium vinaceum]
MAGVRWRDGAWVQVRAAADAARSIDWPVSVDSTVSRAHRHATGARRAVTCSGSRRAVSDEPAGHAWGGPTYALLDTDPAMRPLTARRLTAGQESVSVSATATWPLADA